MPKHGKRYRALRDQVEHNKLYDPSEATTLVKQLATAKFDETVEAHFRLGIDPRKSDQNVRSTVSLPHGTGRSVRVLALVKPDNAESAKAAGADFVGDDDLIKKIKEENWFDYDAVVATPDMMAAIGKDLGRVLGPRGLLPNPKAGTVGPNVGEIIQALKAGRIEFRNDKTGVVHAPIGKASFAAEKLAENLSALRQAVEGAKPENTKGQYLRTLYISTTMGPSIQVTL